MEPYLLLAQYLLQEGRTLLDEEEVLLQFTAKTADRGECENMTLGQFSGHGSGNNSLNLSTLHSSKGREFPVVVMFGIDSGRLPRNNATAREQVEARRLFYVGFTRAKREVHMMYTSHRPSPFVTEVRAQIPNAM